jgi:hypothetical protein
MTQAAFVPKTSDIRELLGIPVYSRLLPATPFTPKRAGRRHVDWAVISRLDGSHFSLVLYWLHVVA